MSEPKYKSGDTVLVSWPSVGKRIVTITAAKEDRFSADAYYESEAYYFRESNIERYAEPVEGVPDAPPVAPDVVNHPAHYTAYPVEVIQLTEHLNFCRGNAVKYVARAGLKNPDTEVQDLEKAVWYLNREIQRLKEQS